MVSKYFAVCVVLLATALAGARGTVAVAAEPLGAHWLVTADLHGTPLYGRMDIEQQGRRITGSFYGDGFEGSGVVLMIGKERLKALMTADKK